MKPPVRNRPRATQKDPNFNSGQFREKRKGPESDVMTTCFNVCASSFKWYSPITEIWMEDKASCVMTLLHDRQGLFPFNPKFRKFRLLHLMEGFILTWSDQNFWNQLWRWSTLTGLVILAWPKCPFPFDKIVVPSTALLYPGYKNNNQMRSGLGRVCANGMYHAIGYVECPKFQTGIFFEWKAPQILPLQQNLQFHNSV